MSGGYLACLFVPFRYLRSAYGVSYIYRRVTDTKRAQKSTRRKDPMRCRSDDILTDVALDETKIKSLIEGACRGNREAVEKLFKFHRENIYQFVYRRVRNPHDTEDLTQDILIKIIVNLPKLRHPERFGGWWMRIALNVMNDYFGKSHRGRFVSVDNYELMALNIEDSALKPDKQAIENQLAYDIQKAIDALPKTQRAVFILKEYDGLSYAEIAAVLGRPVNTIRSNHRHAKQTLRQNQTLRSYLD
jgi:RNA polymerase sigma factor (sigma-70 family)